MMNVGEGELLVTMLQRPAASLTQRRYDADSKVRGRVPAGGES